MNKPDFDTRLRRYLADDAEPPAGFAQRVLAGGARPARPASWVTALAVTAAIVLVAGIAFAVHVTSQSETSRPAPPTSLVSFSSLRMITPLVGWAHASEATPDNLDVAGTLILRTMDGGAQWRLVTPPHGWQPAAAEFFDANNAWAISFPAPGEMSVMRTRDGGTTWQETRIRNQKVVHPKNTGPVTFSFVDADHGWFFVSYDPKRSEEGVLYRTVDGGGHWAIVSVTDPSSQNAGWIPWRGSKNGLTFVDRNTGWLLVNANLPWARKIPKPLLWVTHDGGRSWSEVAYPDVPGFDPTDHAVSRPRFFSATTGVFEIYADRSIIYATRDGGASWQVSRAPACCEISFLDMKTGWISPGRGPAGQTPLYRTSDLGQHWETIRPKFPRDREATKLQFVTPDIGFAVLRSGVVISVPLPLPSIDPEVLRQTIGKTTDGGATWIEMQIVVS